MKETRTTVVTLLFGLVVISAGLRACSIIEEDTTPTQALNKTECENFAKQSTSKPSQRPGLIEVCERDERVLEIERHIRELERRAKERNERELNRPPHPY